MQNSKCKICRRIGTKLFLKGDRCVTPKCAMIKRDYAPGMKAKKVRKNFTEYGKELREKQSLKKWYGLRERQFSNYVKKVLDRRGKVEDAGALLIASLENRLDNVVFRAGFASSRSQARQAVTHGHFLINGKRIDVPSYAVKKEDVVSLRPQSAQKNIFKNLDSALKKQTSPSWIKVDADKLEIKITGEANLEEAMPPAEISSIFEYYSR